MGTTKNKRTKRILIMDDLYKTLNINKKSTKKQIKDSFRKMAKKYHPDKTHSSDDENDKFVAINNAYSILIDDRKRDEYDRTGKVSQQERNEPMSKIACLFIKILENKDVNINKINIIQYIRNDLIKEKEKSVQLIKNAEKYKNLMEKVRSRIEISKNTIPLFENIIEERIGLINRDIEITNKNIELIEKSLEILKKYKDNISLGEVGSIFGTYTEWSIG